MKHLLKWMTLLSFDAPLVAIAWQGLFARAWGNKIGWPETGIVFISVWLGYAGDRWLDANRKVNAISHRHNWYRRHKQVIFILWILVLTLSIGYAAIELTASQLSKGAALAAAAILYTLFAQKGRWLPFYGRAKSMLIALLICASAALFTSPSNGLQFLISPIFLLPAALFYVNCQYIRLWDERPGAKAGSTLTFSIAVLITSVAISFLQTEFTLIGASISLSIAGLWTLDYYQAKLDTTLTRALADLVLLTPVITLALA